MKWWAHCSFCHMHRSDEMRYDVDFRGRSIVDISGGRMRQGTWNATRKHGTRMTDSHAWYCTVAPSVQLLDESNTARRQRRTEALSYTLTEPLLRHTKSHSISGADPSRVQRISLFSLFLLTRSGFELSSKIFCLGRSASRLVHLWFELER